MSASDGWCLNILDGGRLERLDYDGLLRFHQGHAMWGATVAFRALQRAGRYLSGSGLWDRRSLTVTSAHPGPGVRDAVEYVTRCVGRGRYLLTRPELAGSCGKDVQYAWWIDDGTRIVSVQLREGFVPEDFFTLVGRMETAMEQPDDRDRLEQVKGQLIDRLWTEPLELLFQVTEATGAPGATVSPCTS
ncbi:MAG TPA: hypothetical protein PKA61_12600 [Nitrospira sp.]|nr:hypothetical protein [Nitrospira sp.]